MSSILRELVWLEIQQNPGSTVAQIEAALGKDRGGVSAYITQMYNARMIDRKEIFIPCNNVAGKIRCFQYTVATKEYSWVTPGMAKQIKAEAKAIKSMKPALTSATPAPLLKRMSLSHIVAQPTIVDSWITQLPSLLVKDVLKLRKAIDAVFTA